MEKTCPSPVTARFGCLAGAALAAAALAACGGGGSGGTTSSDPTAGGSIEDQLGFSRTAISTSQAQVENGIALCMKQQGFEYVPVDPVAAQAALTGKPNISDADYVKQFGYGISTLYDKGSRQSDPNGPIRAGLDPAQRSAYDQTLSGGRPEQTFFLAVDTGDFTQLGGCTKQATEKAFGGSRLLTTLQAKLDELDESILQDQRMARAQERWTACVRDALGVTFADSEAIEADITTHLTKVVGPSAATAQGAAGRATPSTTYNRAALAAVQQLEVKSANADLACEVKHITPIERIVRKQKEDVFSEVNAELLSRVKPLGR